VRLALKVVMQNDGDFVDVILIYLNINQLVFAMETLRVGNAFLNMMYTRHSDRSFLSRLRRLVPGLSRRRSAGLIWDHSM
jgi:hypothetical protein